MKIAKIHSHLNGYEYLQIHKPELLDEIHNVIDAIKVEDLDPKISQERNMVGQEILSPRNINQAIKTALGEYGWEESRHTYYISNDFQEVEQMKKMESQDQKEFLQDNGHTELYYSYKQTDFLKERVAVEVQFGKYSFVAYDLFVKHQLFYSADKIDVGIEILPTKIMQRNMSSGPSYFEGEVYNILINGRNTPPVPLYIIGIEPE